MNKSDCDAFATMTQAFEKDSREIEKHKMDASSFLEKLKIENPQKMIDDTIKETRREVMVEHIATYFLSNNTNMKLKVISFALVLDFSYSVYVSDCKDVVDLRSTTNVGVIFGAFALVIAILILLLVFAVYTNMHKHFSIPLGRDSATLVSS